MNENEERNDAPERPSSTSPPGGRTHEASSPPGQGDLDEDAAQKARAGLERAAGGEDD